MTKTEFIPIDFRLIDESPLNPRRFITNESVKELSQSIAQQGLLQPITVRPFHAKKIEAPKELVGQMCYQIVCGARRYRACVLAGLKAIPAIVREMTDEEAFDAMITENLQRKDVEPMDEARAFNELNKRGTSFEELAARFGKSVSFIRIRIKLNDLIPELVDLLEKKELQISHAQELCKLTIEHQQRLFKDKYSETAHSYSKWTDKPAKEIKLYLQSDFTSLVDAIFDKADCANCQFRCGANALFEEYTEDRCTNSTCYESKTKDAQLAFFNEKASQGYLIVKAEQLHTKQAELVKELENNFSVLEKNYKNCEWEHAVEKPEREEDETDEEWAERIAEYHSDLSDENERLVNGFQKAVLVNYSGINEILIRFKDGVSLPKNETDYKLSILELEGKNNRNLQLRDEKRIEDLRKLMSDNCEKYRAWNYDLTEIEKAAMYAIIFKHCSYEFKREIEKDFDSSLDPLSNIEKLINTPVMNQIIRAFICTSITDNGASYDKSIQSALRSVAQSAYYDDALRIELKHEETYLKRKENIDKQIKELTDANTEIR